MAERVSSRPIHLVPARPLRCPKCSRRLRQKHAVITQAGWLACESCPGALYVVRLPRRGMAIMLEVRSAQARALMPRTDLTIIDLVRRLSDADPVTLEAYRREISNTE